MLIAAAGLLSGYAALCGLVSWKQTSLLLFPSSELRGKPSDVGMAYSDWRVSSSDGATIHAWQIPPPAGRQRPWVLHCHGNGGNISDRLPLAHHLHRLGLGVVLFDYRGFGHSQGEIGEEKQLLADGQAIYDKLAAMGQPIILYGESLGGGVASYLAEKNPCAGLVLQSTFTRLTDRASEAYPFLPVRWLSRFQLATIDRLDALRCPILVMHGPADEVIGFHHGQQLYAQARQPKDWVELRGGHNSTDLTQVSESVDHWIQERVQP